MVLDYKFIDHQPTLETCWRAIILLGRNVASYKFALAKTLLEIDNKDTLARLEDLALPFARNIAEHLKDNDKQTTSSSSKFLDACRSFNDHEIDEDELRTQAVKLGFVNVIDAFHNVANSEVPRFFEDSRKTSDGINLTDNYFSLLESTQTRNLGYEVDSRWRLWETAISLEINPRLMEINADSEGQTFFVLNKDLRRIDVTSSRDALNGYQKGKCFYCKREIQIEQGLENSCDVDHFFPHILKGFGIKSVDQVWNLVLSCKECNRGASGKFENIPSVKFLELLDQRNNFYIESHHPLKETIINQTGRTVSDRRKFLQTTFNRAADIIPSPEKWEP